MIEEKSNGSTSIKKNVNKKGEVHLKISPGCGWMSTARGNACGDQGQDQPSLQMGMLKSDFDFVLLYIIIKKCGDFFCWLCTLEDINTRMLIGYPVILEFQKSRLQ